MAVMISILQVGRAISRLPMNWKEKIYTIRMAQLQHTKMRRGEGGEEREGGRGMERREGRRGGRGGEEGGEERRGERGKKQPSDITLYTCWTF